MLTFRFLQEGSTGMGFSWLVWVALAIFGGMVVLGWWASGRLPKEDDNVQPHGGDAATDEEVVASHVEEAPEKLEEPVMPLPVAEADDLAKLEGIGPKVAELLASLGITTFAALAAADTNVIMDALEEAGYGFMDPAGWIEQARLAAAGDEERLRMLQEELKGGRRAG